VSTRALLEELNRLGVKLEVDGDRLRYAGPREAISPELIKRLKAHKTDLLALLQRGEKDMPKDQPTSSISIRPSRWPVECLEAERCFGHQVARLYPLLNQIVGTPQGPGRLWQVFTGHAGVVLDSHPESVRFVRPEEVRPYGQGMEPKER
jgi:TubC N-terminal docking domain